jgi:hypothetical protein
MGVNPAFSVIGGWDAKWAPGLPSEGPLPLVRFEEIKPELDAKDFVQGVLAEQSSFVVYGESNSGKTFWTTDLALHVAAGMEWNGRRVEQGGVVYFVLEGGFGFRNRVSAWRTHHGHDDAAFPFAAVPSPLNLLDPDADTQRAIDAIKAAEKMFGMPVKMVVIDTLARAMAGGNENAPDDMGALVSNMDRIRNATKAATGFVHHSGKDAAKGARGHSSLRAAIDTEIEVTALDGAHNASVEKQRDMPKGAQFGFRLHVLELGHNRHGEAVTSCVVEPMDGSGPQRPRKLSGDQDAAYRILNDAIAESGQPDVPGVVGGVPSIPEDWWRERFYNRAKPGASQEAKKKAFRRAADDLARMGLVGANRGRVWVSR